MLSSEIIKQGQLFGEAVLFGAAFMLLYDCMRILRRIRRHGMAAVAVEDLLFWLQCALGIFGFMYWQNDGVIRGFLIIGVAAGMVTWNVLASRYVVRLGTICVCRVLHLLECFWDLVSAPFHRFGKFVYGKTGQNCVFCKKVLQKWKKQLKKVSKVVRMEMRRL